MQDPQLRGAWHVRQHEMRAALRTQRMSTMPTMCLCVCVNADRFLRLSFVHKVYDFYTTKKLWKGRAGATEWTSRSRAAKDEDNGRHPKKNHGQGAAKWLA